MTADWNKGQFAGHAAITGKTQTMSRVFRPETNCACEARPAAHWPLKPPNTRGSHQPKGLVKTVHQIERLYRLTAGAFDQVVLSADHE